MRIVINGITGLVGSNLFFECIKQNLRQLNSLEIFLLGRSNATQGFKERVIDIFYNEGLPYIQLQKDRIHEIDHFLKSKVYFIEMDLNQEDLNINSSDLKMLKALSIDFFFHVAASVDLQNSSRTERKLYKTNVLGTKHILTLAKSLNIKEFCYVSTAYCCGTTTGRIMPDYINLNQKFNNPYELSKLQAEIEVRSFAKKTGTKCRYFRPSIICGRLMEQPLGLINKFDVFYQSAALFLAMKLNDIKSGQDKYETPVKFDLRVFYNSQTGLNVIPVDYLVKVIYQVCVQNDQGESYHLVNDNLISIELMMSSILEVLNIKGPYLVEEMPKELNLKEKLYYQTVGNVATPYLIMENKIFDTENLQSVLSKSNLKCPTIDKKNFMHLLQYAKKQDFGLDNYYWL